METLKSKTFTISAENVREKSQQYHYEKGQKNGSLNVTFQTIQFMRIRKENVHFDPPPNVHSISPALSSSEK